MKLTRDNPEMSPSVMLAMSHKPFIAKKEKPKVFDATSSSSAVAGGSGQKWIWTPFHSTARTDNAVFYHWEKATPDGTRPEYTGAYKFDHLNKKILCFLYTDEEYEQCLNFMDSRWSKEDTDELFSLCRQYDLRWIIIKDRISDRQQHRSMEELKDRYYSIAQKLIEIRADTKELRERAKYHPVMVNPYDYEYDVKRKQALEQLFTRSREAEEREAYIREQLKKIDAIKKRRQEEARKEAEKERKRLEKRRKAMPSFGTPQIINMNDEHDVAAMPHTVALMRGKVGGPQGVYSRSALMEASLERNKRMKHVFTEFGMPENPMPTAKVHEAYEHFLQRANYYLELQRRVAVSSLSGGTDASSSSSSAPSAGAAVFDFDATTTSVSQRAVKAATTAARRDRKKKKTSPPSSSAAASDSQQQQHQQLPPPPQS